MIYEAHYDWDVDFSQVKSDYEDGISRIYSPQFMESPDESAHYWTFCLSFDPADPENYGFWVNLDDKPFYKNIIMRYSYKVFDYDNQLLCNGSSTAHKFDKIEGIGHFFLCYEKIKRIYVELELLR
ncbi:hypothetical protein ACFFRR_010563 [Megaselia abdita]